MRISLGRQPRAAWPSGIWAPSMVLPSLTCGSHVQKMEQSDCSCPCLHIIIPARRKEERGGGGHILPFKDTTLKLALSLVLRTLSAVQE